MLSFLSGRMGGGKSYFAVHDMIHEARTRPERHICTNIDLTDEGRDMIGRQRLIELDYDQIKRFWEYTPAGSSTWIDETQIHFDSRRTREHVKDDPNNDMMKYLTHIRKMKDDVTIISQEFDFVDRRFRSLASLFTYTISLKACLGAFGLYPAFLPEIFLARSFLDIELTQHAYNRWLVFSPKIGSAYDSWAVETAHGIQRLQSAVCLDEGEVSKEPVPYRKYAAALILAAYVSYWGSYFL